MDAIEERGRHWEAKLRVEAEEQVEVHEELRKFFEETLKHTMEVERQNLRDTMDRFHNDLIPPQQDRMEDNEKMVEVFVSETVPAVVDRQSGIVGRKLQKAHETFDVRPPTSLLAVHAYAQGLSRLSHLSPCVCPPPLTD